MLKCKSGPLKPYYRKRGEHYWRNVSLPLVLLDVGHFLVGLVRFLVLLLGVSLNENVLKITSGRQNVKLLWHLFKLFVVLYALGYVLGKYMHILP